MPRIKHNTVFNFARGFGAFLRLDAGVGRHVPASPEKQLRQEKQRRQRAEKRLKRREEQLRQEKQRRQRAERRRQRAEKRPKRREVVVPNEDLKGQVRKWYAKAALAVRGTGEGEKASYCEPSSCGPDSQDSKVDLTGGSLTGGSYSAEELGELPGSATAASLGCGNPVALATLSPGEVVLDLGSGGGIDVLLSARRVSPGGKAYGLDMTDEMLTLARKNQEEAGVENVEFLKGEIEEIPLPDEHVDVVISNCVINLSTEKERVIREAYRVLKPGGRFAVSDVVFLGDKSALPKEVMRSAERWCGCISGALERAEYEQSLAAAGFEDVSVEVTQVYEPEAITGLRDAKDVEVLQEVPIASAFVRARKPLG
jgi:arsenite methyltransferase